jgi:hypothetical protein
MIPGERTSSAICPSLRNGSLRGLDVLLQSFGIQDVRAILSRWRTQFLSSPVVRDISLMIVN